MAPDTCPVCCSPRHPATALCLLCDLIRAADPDHCGDHDCSAAQFRAMSRHWFRKVPTEVWN